MIFADIPWRPRPRTLRQFGALWLAFFGLLAWRAGFPAVREGAPLILAVLAVTVGLLGLLSPAAVRPVFIGWMVLVFPIGWAVSRVLLALLFFGLFTPLGLAFRLAGRDALCLRRPKGVSCWRPRPAPANLTTYFHPY